MRAGPMRHQVVIEGRQATQDTFGEQSTTWATVDTVYADINPLSGREREAAQAINVEISHEITIRYQDEFSDPRVVAAYRVRYGTRLFNIHGSANVDERNREITLLAGEGMTVV
jgi:SPP1 family predicted phage head-tail adaptor